MSPRSPSATVEVLLEHAGWLRRLARSLVGDSQHAEDLSQETWLRALQHPPRTDVPVRGWLATVMRNVLRQERRGASRRAARERRVARGSDEPDGRASGLDLLEKVSMQRELVEAVLELEEPYRETVLLRYFEECPPKRIAADTGVPVATVKTRLARGLERLRARLDETHGSDGRSWALALLPVARRPFGLSPSLSVSEISLGALAVNTKFFLAAVGLGVVGATLYVMSGGEDGERPVESVASRPAPPSKVGPAAGGGGSEEVRAVEAVEERRAAVAPEPTEAPERTEARPVDALLVRGRVLDVEGRPVAGVEVRTGAGGGTADALEGTPLGEPLAVTAGDGGFEVRLDRGASLVVRDERYTTVLAGSAVAEDSGKETLVIVAPRIPISGEVVDAAGPPVAGAAVLLEPPEDLRARLGQVLDYSSGVRYRAETDEGGWFELADAPAIPGARLVVKHEGYDVLEEPAPLVARPDLVLVLQRLAPTANVLAGVVVDGSGFPVDGALVSMGIDTRKTDESGAFEFDLDAPQSFNRMASRYFTIDTGTLLAVKRGYLPAELKASRRDDDGEPVWPDRIVLRLGSTPLSIAGEVVDTDRRPLPGIQVWIADPTFLGGLGDPSAGGFPSLTHVETELAGAEPGWHAVETDGDGRFEIEGLLDRDYEVQAMDPVTLLRIEQRDVRAGKRDLELVMPKDASYEVLRGKVVDRRGRPVEGVYVRPMCDAFRTLVQGQTAGTYHETADGTRTDAEGRFELRDVPRDLVYLRLDGVDTIPLEWGRHVEGGLAKLVGERFDQLVIVVGRRCHFQVELADPDEADEIAVLDADGEELEISEFLGNGRKEGVRQPLDAGRTNPLGVGDAAATLVLLKDGEEIRRAPLHLTPGEQVTVRP